MPALPAALDREVERHWAAACARLPLFNGRVFAPDHLAPEVIEGHWTEYRRIVAQMADHDLRPVLGVRSLAVCGVLCGPDGVAIGRRDPASAYQAGMWQFPPAGSVDTGAAVPGGADWRSALLAELHEEMGILPAAVRALRPLCIVEHPSGVMDLGIRIDTALDAAAVTRCHAGAAHREYDRLLVAPTDQVLARVAALGGTPVPSAAVFLRLAQTNAQPGAQTGAQPGTQTGV